MKLRLGNCCSSICIPSYWYLSGDDSINVPIPCRQNFVFICYLFKIKLGHPKERLVIELSHLNDPTKHIIIINLVLIAIYC